MKVIMFGATGMVGQGVLRECLLAADVESVLVVGRTGTGRRDGKLRELNHADFTDFTGIEEQLRGYDACFFCLGVSSAGMSEAAYRRVTYDFTMAAATVLARVNPGMTFVYVSGAGTDSSEQGRVRWARIKGKTENDVLALPLRAYAMRPGIILPRHGVRSKTRLYATIYTLAAPLYPLLRRSKYVTTTPAVGQAMLAVVRSGAPRPVLENRDINALAPDAE